LSRSDAEAALALRDFAAESLCEETVDALLAIREFQTAETEFSRRRLAEWIAVRFLSQNAPTPVNVAARTRQAAMTEFGAVKPGEVIPRNLYEELAVKHSFFFFFSFHAKKGSIESSCAH
jgi:hypothetical protein